MPLTILSAKQLHSLLLSLTRDEILQLQHNLADSLREYSTGSQNEGCAASYQPQRTAITRQNGCTTLFMPASTGKTLGIKAISLDDGGEAGCADVAVNTAAPAAAAAAAAAAASTPSAARFELPQATKTAARSRSGARSSMTSLSSDKSELSASSDDDDDNDDDDNDDNDNDNDKDESRSTTATARANSSGLPSGSVNRQPVAVATKGLSSTLGAWPAAGTRDTSPRGSVTLLDAASLPFGLINARELTPFRTALTAMMLFHKRQRVRTVTVFGAGNQAYWHIRLALTLRGPEIKRVYIVNRSFERAAALLQDIYSAANAGWRGDVKFSAVSSDFGEYPRILKEAVRKADAIFCCTPAVEPLFPATFLTSRQGRQKTRFVCAIGSYKPHMTELHPDILRDEVRAHSHHHRHRFHTHATRRSGVVVVDSLDAALREAGEIIQAGIKPNQVVEVGELLMVQPSAASASASASASAASSASSASASSASVPRAETASSQQDKSLQDWLERGNLIYKSVGLGLMDLVTGGDLIRLARERRVGTTVDEI